jgi:hypothetical protein
MFSARVTCDRPGLRSGPRARRGEFEAPGSPIEGGKIVTCTVCQLEPRKVSAIDEALRGNASLQQISAEHGVRKSSLWRHTKHAHPAEAPVGRTQRNALDTLNAAARNKCIGLLLYGKPSAILQAARLAGVTRKAALEYKRRVVDKAVAIAAELEQARAQVGPWAADSETTTQTVREVAKALPVLAVREKRLHALQNRHDRLELVMSERADDMADVLGGSSGLLVRQVKQIGSGESARMVEEYKLDTE